MCNLIATASPSANEVRLMMLEPWFCQPFFDVMKPMFVEGGEGDLDQLRKGVRHPIIKKMRQFT